MIARAIYSILSSDSALTAEVGDRIYGVYASEQVANPCVIFEVESADPAYTKDGAAPVIFINLEVDVFATGYDAAWALEALVRSALDQYSGTSNGEDIDLIQWEGSDDAGFDPNNGEYQVGMGFRIRTK